MPQTACNEHFYTYIAASLLQNKININQHHKLTA